ncbi:MAG: hypothetical protein ACYDAD_01870 [Acidimicrobiales bacterium]
MNRAARRLSLLGTLCAAALGLLVPQALASGTPQVPAPESAVRLASSAGQPWFCIYNEQINFGLCQYDPLAL